MADAPYVPTAEDRDVQRQAIDDEALLRTARARFDQSVAAETILREEFVVDQRFRAGEQWLDADMRSRQVPGEERACLSINLLPSAIAQITNEQRAHPPSMRVSPTGNGAQQDVAQICDGLLRHIQQESQAHVAYETAGAEAAAIGRGWFRLITEYESPHSFAQVLRILRILNPLTIYPQPYLREPDYSDMQWCFLVERMAHDDFLAAYPQMQPDEMAAWIDRGGDTWIDRDSVRVAEYFYREMVTVPLALLSDGTVVEHRRASQAEMAAQAAQLGLTVVAERQSQVPVVWWCKITGHQVLERVRWPGSWIPIIPVLGDEFAVGDRIRLSGIIRDARDPQRMVNFFASAQAEAIALAPRAPWILAEGQDEGYEDEWATANTRNHAALHYHPVDIRGTPVPPPGRNVQEPAIQAINQGLATAANHFQQTTRVFDASYGAPSNERSGRAIQIRDQNSDMSNSHFHGNLARSIYHAGRQMLELLPIIYHEPGRVLRIVAEDGTEKQVTVNAPHIDDETGLEAFYALGQGTYAVAVTVGPSYETKRQEAYAGLLDMAKADPQIMAAGRDLVVSQSDNPAARELAQRLKKTIPPTLLDDTSQDKDTQLMIATGKIAQLTQQAQALNAHAAAIEQAHQQSMQTCQALQQENTALRNDRDTDHAALALKQQEAAFKMQEAMQRADTDRRGEGLEQQRVALEQQKIDLDVERLLLAREQAQQALEETRMQRQYQTEAAQAEITESARLRDIATTLAQTQQQLLDAMQILAQTAQDQQALKTVTMHREADGTLIGEVHDQAGTLVRRLQVRT